MTGRQDSTVGYSRAWELLEQYPRATFAVLDRAGHALPHEQPELLRALVTEWLDRVREQPPARQLTQGVITFAMSAATCSQLQCRTTAARAAAEISCHCGRGRDTSSPSLAVRSSTSPVSNDARCRYAAG